jgi:hypothetical protein
MAIELSSSEKESPSLIVGILLTIAILALLAAIGGFAYFHFMVNPEKGNNPTKINNGRTLPGRSGGLRQRGDRLQDLIPVARQSIEVF